MDNIGDENLPHSFTYVSGCESDMEWVSTPVVTFSNWKKGEVIMTNVYLLDVNRNPLMPCHNGGFIRKLLKQGKAKVVRSCPFTVQLLYEVRNKYKQDISLGVDSGYTYIGLSATTKKAELFSAEIKQDCGMVERNNKRVKYRRQRRNRLRYRKARFDNRVHSKPKGWIAHLLSVSLTHI